MYKRQVLTIGCAIACLVLSGRESFPSAVLATAAAISSWLGLAAITGTFPRAVTGALSVFGLFGNFLLYFFSVVLFFARKKPGKEGIYGVVLFTGALFSGLSTWAMMTFLGGLASI